MTLRLLLAALALLVAAPARGNVPTPPLAEAPAETVPGLTLTITVGEKKDVRPVRLAALFVPAGQPPSATLPAGPFTAKWEGDILSPLRAEHLFAADANGAFRILINGAEVLSSDGTQPTKKAANPLQLNKGANKLVIEYTSPAQGDAMFRLNWIGKEYPQEPVPPTVFSHNGAATELRTAARLREGRMLFAQNRCLACHDGEGLAPAKGEGMPELQHDAPVFADLGARFNETWLAHWINDPHAIRPGTLMPKMFHGAAEGEVDQRAADLAAYFVSTGARKDAATAEEDVAPGGALFANLGCIACHTTPEWQGEDEFKRVPLSHLKAKWQSPALLEYLKDPQQNYKWTRMPNFRLSDAEAKQLTAFLLAGAQREFPAGPKGDPMKGGQLVVSAGCLNCHAGLPPMTTPKLAKTLESGWTTGCMAADDSARKTAPDFRFTGAQREALQALANSSFSSLRQDDPAEFAHRQVANLRCTACHAQDTQTSAWSQLEGEMAALQAGAPVHEEEGAPVGGATAPPMTWFGEKLQADWAAQFITGAGVSYKPRPWLIARMPGFGVYGDHMALGLAHQHGFGKKRAPEAIDPEKATAGVALAGEGNGLHCTTCHAVADKPATAVFEAPGINLGYAKARLRKEYYMRWVLHPQRVDPETKMPRFSDDAGKTTLTDFFGGSAAEQTDAIWQYLQSVGKQPENNAP